MKATFTSLSFALAMVGAGIGEEPATQAPEMTPAMAAVLANNREYEEAYAKADVDALAAFFTEDAEYTSDDGRTFSGRDAHRGLPARCLPDQQGLENLDQRGFGETAHAGGGGGKGLDDRRFQNRR